MLHAGPLLGANMVVVELVAGAIMVVFGISVVVGDIVVAGISPVVGISAVVGAVVIVLLMTGDRAVVAVVVGYVAP